MKLRAQKILQGFPQHLHYVMQSKTYFDICTGEPDEMYVRCSQKVVILDVTTTEFKFKAEVDVKMKRADYISYLKLSNIGSAVATTEGHPFFKLNVTSVEGNEVLYTVGGKDEKGGRNKVAGVLWRPIGVCNDGLRLYVADMWGKRLVIIDVSTGEVIQTVVPPELGDICVTSWCNYQQRLIVQHEKNYKCYISFFELEQP